VPIVVRKLPFTYPKYRHNLVNYIQKYREINENEEEDRMWGFGHGLSYPTFEYRSLNISTTV
jgi:hypothetical protein